MMFRRPRPTGGRHPPPIAPSYSEFKPRSEWNISRASMFLYVNLPGFYRDQIEIKSDKKTRTLQIQGERPLSTQTRARFNETYRVPESCDMSTERMQVSFSRGLLTIEMPIASASVAGGSSERKTPAKDEKLADGKEVIDRKVREQEGRRAATDGSLGRKQLQKDEKRIGEEKEDAAVDGSLGRKQPAKDEKLVGETGDSREIQETVKPGEADLGKGAEKRTNGEIENVGGGIMIRNEDWERGIELRSDKNQEKEPRRTASSDSEKKEVNVGEDTKNRIERVNAQSELSRGTVPVDIKDRKEADQNGKSHEAYGQGKKLTSAVGEEEMMKTGRGSQEAAMAMDDEKQEQEKEKEKETESLVNVGVAALVIMGFGAYLFVPLLKLFY